MLSQEKCYEHLIVLLRWLAAHTSVRRVCRHELAWVTFTSPGKRTLISLISETEKLRLGKVS